MSSFFFFNDTATTEIYTLSLHDALPICSLTGSTGSSRVRDELKQCALVDDSATRSNDRSEVKNGPSWLRTRRRSQMFKHQVRSLGRSEEHTSELQSPCNLVCRLLLEKKKKGITSSSRLSPYFRCRPLPSPCGSRRCSSPPAGRS